MEMVLPSNYFEVEQEEMFYLDGGATVKKRVWGYSVTMSRAESRNVQYYLGQVKTGGYTIAGVAAGIATVLGAFGNVIGTAIAASFGAVSFGVGGYCDLMQGSLKHHTTSKGVVLNLSKIGIFWSSGR